LDYLSTDFESETLGQMIRALQLRAARALLGWKQSDLAKAAGIGIATVARVEQSDGVAGGNVSTIVSLQEALERRGIRFIEQEDGTFGVIVKRK
jgi:transcriptional regulator with XRE-family HTH domain